MTEQQTQPDRKQVPLRGGIFRLPSGPGEEAALIGSRCQSCGTYFFPKRYICLNCGQEGIEETALGRRGKIWTYTIARQTPPGSLMQAPYVIAMVQLTEGPIVETVLTGCEPEAVYIGMEVEMVLEKMGTSAEGNDLMAFKFKPV
ncbi:MAG: Zn-ribbon domain-containing OB-fold protein [Dehalococcoidia bacterium]